MTKSCNLCKIDNLEVLYKLKKFDIFKCKECGLTFSDYSSISKKELYGEDYFTEVHSNFFGERGKDYMRYVKGSKKLQQFLKVLDQLKKFKQEGKILDIGCATGVFLDMARKKGYKPQGLDISAYAAKQAKDDFDIDIFVGELDKAPFAKKTFDIITMWDFIEHVDEPSEALRKINELLKDDGIIFILTINEDSLIVNLADWVYKLSFGIIKKPVALVHPVHHATHFSEATLTKMLNKNGFNPILRKKSEIPLQNVEGGIMTKAIVGLIYMMAKLLGKQYDITMIAKKN